MPDDPDAPPTRLRTLPTWVLGMAAVRSHRILVDGLASTGARGYDYRLLASLEEFGPASQAELGRRARLDRSDVVATVNDLARSGFVRRTADPDDGRRNIITITRPGAGRLRALDIVLADVQERLLAPLSPAERTQLVALLGRIIEPDMT